MYFISKHFIFRSKYQILNNYSWLKFAAFMIQRLEGENIFYADNNTLYLQIFHYLNC